MTAEKGALFYLADWLPPDFGAVGQYALIYATQQARAGRAVHLFGLNAHAESRTEETFPSGGKLTITRLKTGAPDKRSYLSRMAWFGANNLRLVGRLARERPDRGAEVIFTGSPPFMLFFALWLKPLFRVRLTYRITDFYPEVIVAGLRRPSLPLKAFSRLTWFLRHRVDTFQALGEDQKRLLLAGGIAKTRVRVLRDGAPVQVSADTRPTEKPEALKGHLVLLYSGNLGVAHEAQTVLEGLKLHRRDGSARFGLWLNGTGVHAERLCEALEAAGVPVARTDSVPLEDLPGVLAAADAHLITLRRGYEGLVLPSKVYGCLASGRPIVFVGPEGSDVHLLCSGGGGRYARVEPGDGPGFAEVLERLERAGFGERKLETALNPP